MVKINKCCMKKKLNLSRKEHFYIYSTDIKSIATNLADELPRIKNDIIDIIEDSIFRSIGHKISYENRIIISKNILNECMSLCITDSDESYAKVVSVIESIINEYIEK